MQQVLRIGDTVAFKDTTTLTGSVSVFNALVQQKLGLNYELTVVGYQQFNPNRDLLNEDTTPGFAVPNNCHVWVTAGIEIPGFTRTRDYQGKRVSCIRLWRSLIEPFLFDDGLDNWV